MSPNSILTHNLNKKTAATYIKITLNLTPLPLTAPKGRSVFIKYNAKDSYIHEIASKHHLTKLFKETNYARIEKKLKDRLSEGIHGLRGMPKLIGLPPETDEERVKNKE